MEADLVERLGQVLGHGRGGLVTDVDGTISPIVEQPERAMVLPAARRALAGLAETLALVAVVSGRATADAQRLVGLDGLVYVGNHGLEVDGETVAEARPWVARLGGVLETLAGELGGQPGVRIENKGITGSIHYRLAPDPPAARARILELVGRRALTSGLRLEEGRMVVNLLPPLRVSKGSAVRWLAQSYRLDGLVYFGDDLTDVHAFETLRALGTSGQVQTLGIGVVGPETPARVRQVIDACVPSPEAVAALLGALLEWLHPSDTMEAGVPSTVRSSE